MHDEPFKQGPNAKARKLTDEQAREIFLSSERQRTLADKYGVSVSIINSVKAKRAYTDATKGLRMGVYVKDTKLTDELVKEIYESDLTHKEIAEKYDMSVGHVAGIKTRRAWAKTTCGLIRGDSRRKKSDDK